MRIGVACIVMLLFFNLCLYAQGDTKRSTAPTAASLIADINGMYDNMEQAIKLEYSKLVKENKRKTDELNDKIKQVDQEIAKVKNQIRKLEEVLAKMEDLMAKMMKEMNSERQNVNPFNQFEPEHPRDLKYIRDSIKQTIPAQTTARKDSLIKLTQIHY